MTVRTTNYGVIESGSLETSYLSRISRASGSLNTVTL